MPALGLGLEAMGVAELRRKVLREPRSGARRRKRGGDASPDSMIYSSSDYPSSIGNGGGGGGSSLLSSAAGSVTDRCSFGSDHDPVFSVLPLAGRDRVSGGPPADPDPESRSSLPLPSPDILTLSPCHSLPPPKSSTGLTVPPEDFEQSEEDEEEGKEEDELVVVEEESLDPSKHSFSHALRECQNRRWCRSEAVALPGRKLRRRRPASLDFHGKSADVSVLSPRYFVGGLARMKSSAASSRSRSGTFASPGTPNYLHSASTAVFQKGWSSERVPLPAHSNRRYGGSGILLPFTNGRTLPSKWEDAERWILSPVSGDGVGRLSMPPSHHRRPKSKSGPLGATVGVGGAYSSASPLVPCFDSGRVGNFVGNSPFLAGVLMPERGFCTNGSIGRGGGGSGGGGTRRVVGVGVGIGECGKGNLHDGDNYIVRSASIHGWSDTLIESSSSVPSSQDEKSEGTREATSMTSASVLRKDVATQMSPEGSTESSPKERPLSPSLASAPQIEELESHFSKLQVRDVQVDDRVTVTRWSKKHVARGTDKRSASIIEWKKKTVEANTSPWEVTDTAKSVSKFKREEAKITAWENLQKAKAEAEIRKLEMKLEKKRSSSMEKILNKLRSAQKKAQEMRSAVTANQANQSSDLGQMCLFFRAMYLYFGTGWSSPAIPRLPASQGLVVTGNCRVSMGVTD
ncbi:hypothetical protein Cni_G28818 [Canna indica]|uniref:Remorin C-terminal domain-containing protein n=1 Tax=Canna indica TaxID=4628 RepID=A0AAQ3QP38_9LILI|nr:hypothetical protein Cni_G28818 [Canna indica]